MNERSPPVGIDHPTVVPANLDPERQASDRSDETQSSTDGS